MKHIFISLLVICFSIVLGCRPKDPSILKIYVRNYSNVLEKEANVMIVLKSDVLSEYYTSSVTNDNGYATFNLDEFFSQFSSKDDKVADFKVYATSKSDKKGEKMVRPRAHITSSSTINLEQ